MDITSLPKEKQQKWLLQRGWQPADNKTDIWVDPDTRTESHITVAVKKAIAECRLPSDLELR